MFSRWKRGVQIYFRFISDWNWGDAHGTRSNRGHTQQNTLGASFSPRNIFLNLSMSSRDFRGDCSWLGTPKRRDWVPRSAYFSPRIVFLTIIEFEGFQGGLLSIGPPLYDAERRAWSWGKIPTRGRVQVENNFSFLIECLQTHIYKFPIFLSNLMEYDQCDGFFLLIFRTKWNSTRLKIKCKTIMTVLFQ